VHPESVTLLATVESGIRSLSDLPGKRVNIGNPGSGQRGNALEVLNAVGIDWERDLHAESAKASESSKLLQDGRIDAFFYTVGHPAGAFSEATAGRRATRFVPITGVGRLLEQRPYYAPSTVDVSLYPNAENTAEVETIGVMTTLVSSADVPEELVYTVTRVLFENLDRFRSMHPAFARLQAEDMTRLGLSAPLHPGALRYYREAGLLE
jgi:TRAP transporter TAXI family solute receptor